MKKLAIYIVILALSGFLPLKAQFYALKVTANNSTKIYPLSDGPAISFTNLDKGINIKMFVKLKDKSIIEYKLKNDYRIAFNEKAKFPEMKVTYDGNKTAVYKLDSILLIEFNTYMISGTGDSSSFSLTPVRLYPNPFSEETAIEFILDYPQRVIITISDINGKIVKELNKKDYPAGLTTVVWNGKDENGENAHPGLYYCLIKTAEGIIAEKLIKIE